MQSTELRNFSQHVTKPLPAWWSSKAEGWAMHLEGKRRDTESSQPFWKDVLFNVAGCKHQNISCFVASRVLGNWPNSDATTLSEVSRILSAAKHRWEVAEEFGIGFNAAPAIACRRWYLLPARSTANVLLEISLHRLAFGA